MKKRVALTICAPIVVCAMAWLAGFNFDERGFVSFLVFYIAFFSAVLTWLFSGILKK